MSLDAVWNGLLELVRDEDGGRFRDAVLASAPQLSCLEPRRERPYGRRVLFRCELGEVMLASWPAGGRALPHDHGDARGFVVVVAGGFTERTYGFEARELWVNSSRELAAGDLLRVSPDGIHDMESHEAGLTLHAYVPPIPRMRVYDTPARTTFLVSGECGAWVPNNPQHVLEQERWA
jgi:cysteine dioxygenase